MFSWPTVKIPCLLLQNNCLHIGARNQTLRASSTSYSPLRLTRNRSAGQLGFTTGSSEGQQPIYYWPAMWHPREAFHLGDCNSSPCASWSAHLLKAHAARGGGKKYSDSLTRAKTASVQKPLGNPPSPYNFIMFSKQQLFRFSIFWLACSSWAPTQSYNQGAHRGERRPGRACPRLEGERNKPVSWRSWAHLPS